MWTINQSGWRDARETIAQMENFDTMAISKSCTPKNVFVIWNIFLGFIDFAGASELLVVVDAGGMWWCFGNYQGYSIAGWKSRTAGDCWGFLWSDVFEMNDWGLFYLQIFCHSEKKLFYLSFQRLKTENLSFLKFVIKCLKNGFARILSRGYLVECSKYQSSVAKAYIKRNLF